VSFSAKIRAVIVEDERVLREELRETVQRLWPELEICAEAKNGVEALDALDMYRPDAIFLDIQMHGMSGLDVAREASGRCHIVFVTAFDEFAVAAFEHGAIDYVMKPFSTERIALAISRLRDRLESSPPNVDLLIERLNSRIAVPKSFLRWINASQGNDYRLITVDEVCYFRSDAKYTRVITASQESLIRKSVRELCTQLDPDVFWQIHRSIIVNLHAVAGVDRDFRGNLSLRMKRRAETLPVSQPYASRFRPT
jgi:DNA-binding LytR/AlgR family response regulator